ncbi:MAG: hypothetical protein HYY59_07385 [Candidatus Omnitrophica bacterium]|nr:hypothetical protein [Candidatus Omnitrophota bacterium]
MTPEAAEVRIAAPSIDAGELYDVAAAGGEFWFYQDLRDKSPRWYDECYFNPDCVLLFPETRQVYWFDLDHVSVGAEATGTRRHVLGNLWRKKFAFASDGNRLSILPCAVTGLWRGRPTAMRPQETEGIAYVVGDRYRRVCEIRADGTMDPQERRELDEAWRQHRKLKVGVPLGRSVLIYGIRLAFQQKGVYSFASKTVVIPSPQARAFSWEQASLGNICVGSDGSCSIYREQTSRPGLLQVLATYAPTVLQRASGMLNRSPDGFKEWVRSLARPMLRCLLTFEVDHARCPFTIFVREADG